MMNDHTSLSRLDSFPYRHRLSEVMAQPVLTGTEDLSLAAACDQMDQAKVSSLVVIDADGRAVGIVTERDVMRAIARRHAAALDTPLTEVMSTPVRTVPGDAYLYVGIARMTRLGLRHLIVTDDRHRPIGMITGRALLKVRASQALVIGDDVAEAQSPADLERTRLMLPILARNLLADGVAARDIAGIISTVLRDITTRAAELTETAMAADGWGAAPARWALLVLGSGGRGESLLAFDQDNAIVHEGGEADDAWFAEFARRLNDALHAAGIPYCPGEVMARNPFWRRSLEAWKDEIRQWVFEPKMQTVMNVDIFFDFLPVYGDSDLAMELKRYAAETAAASAFFVQFLAFNVANMASPLGLLGQFATTSGRMNAKKLGLLPITSAARAKAVRHNILATASADRFAALSASGHMHADDLTTILAAHETILHVILNQQLTDLDAGRTPSAMIEPRRLPSPMRHRLKGAFRRIRLLKLMVGAAG